MNLVVLFNFVDLVILVILVILDFPVIWLNLVDLVSSHFWDFCILLDGIETCLKNNLESEKIPESKWYQSSCTKSIKDQALKLIHFSFATIVKNFILVKK